MGRASSLNNLAATYANAVSTPSGSSSSGVTNSIRGNSLTGNNVNSSGDVKGGVRGGTGVTGGVKPAHSTTPAVNEMNTGTGDIRNPDIKSNNVDIKSNSTPAGDIRNTHSNTSTYTSPGQTSNENDVRGNDPRDVKTNTGSPNEYSNPRNEHYTPGNNGGVKQPYSDPRYTPQGDTKGNSGSVKSDGTPNSNSVKGSTKGHGIFGGHSNDPAPVKGEHQYAEPKKSVGSGYSSPRNDTPKQNSQPSYQQPRNNSQPASHQEKPHS